MKDMRRARDTHANRLILPCLLVAWLCCVTPLDAQDPAPQPQRSPEYYKDIRNELRQRIADQLTKADLRAMGWFADVRETADQIEIERETWSLTFDKKTAGVTHAVVAGRELSQDHGLALADVRLIDHTGREFRQSWANDGQLTVTSDPRHVYLQGQFTPRADDGTALGARFWIKYDIYKSCGLTTVRLGLLEGSASITELRAVHTLGQTPQPLRFFQHSNNSIDGKNYYIGSCSDMELVDYNDAVYFQQKFGSAIWSDGAIGLQAIPLPETYLNSPPTGGVPATAITQPGQAPSAAAVDANDPRYSPDRYLFVAVRDQASHLDFVLMQRESAATLDTRYDIGWSFSLLPFKRLQPKSIIACLPLIEVSFNYGKHGPPEQVEQLLSDVAVRNPDYLQHFLTHNAGGQDGMFMPDNENTRWSRMAVEKARKYGMQAQGGFIFWTGVSAEQMQRHPLLTTEELDTLRAVANADPQAEHFQCDTNSPIYRDYMLSYPVIAARELGAPIGVYFDLCYVYGPLPGNPSNIEGNVILLEDLRLLLDSYEPGLPVTWHSGGQVTPAESLASWTLPGEPISGAELPFMTPGQFAIAYNAQLIGSPITPYELGWTFDIEQPNIWKQFLANSIFSSADLDVVPRKTLRAEIFPLVEKYFYPMRTFGVDDSRLHSWRDSDISEYVTVDNPACMTNLYVKPGEILLTASLPPQQPGKSTFKLNASTLGLHADHVLFYDTLRQTTRVLPVVDGQITLSAIDLTDEPAILYLRQLDDPTKPLIYWHEDNLEILNCEEITDGVAVNQRKLSIALRMKIAPADGAKATFRLYHGSLGPLLSTFLASIHKVGGEPNVQTSVLQVTAPQRENPQEISWSTEETILFFNLPAGWR